MTFTRSPHRPPNMIEQDINALKFKIQNEPLPSIAVCQGEVHRWTTKAVLDDQFRADLWEATQALERAHAAWAARASDNTTLNTLAKELDESQAARRMELIRQADDNLNRAINEYQHNCLLAARALRTVLVAQHRSANTPGAQYNLDHLRLSQFHVPHLWPISFQGALGKGMIDGRQSWEEQPQHERAAA